jgi:hypothetical protein
MDSDCHSRIVWDSLPVLEGAAEMSKQILIYKIIPKDHPLRTEWEETTLDEIKESVKDTPEFYEDVLRFTAVKYTDHIAAVVKYKALLREWRNLNCEAPQWQYDDLFERTDELIGEK